MNDQQRKLLAFRGYNPYDTLGSWQRLAAEGGRVSNLGVPLEEARTRQRWSEADANRWLRQAS